MAELSLTGIQIKMLFTTSELFEIEVKKDPGITQLIRLLNDPNLPPINVSDKLFVDMISHLNYLKILTPERTAVVLSGVRP